MKKRVTGLGGVFFKCKDPELIKNWYQTHLGIESDQYGGHFQWRKEDSPDEKAITAWSPFAENTDYFKPSDKQFMFNYRVENLVELLKILKEEGVQQIGEMQIFDYGKFAWVFDPEGNKIELWEPLDQVLIDYHEKKQ